MTDTATTKADWSSDQEVRWCPGCGDYSILNGVQAAFAEIGMSRENTVIVSGIGCSSRFPYYMSTYGFHSIHGRAPAIATGVKLGNPELDLGFWLPSLTAEGGPRPEAMLPKSPEMAARVGGFFAARAGLPVLPYAPRVRTVQLQQLRTALPWAARARVPPSPG